MVSFQENPLERMKIVISAETSDCLTMFRINERVFYVRLIVSGIHNISTDIQTTAEKVGAL